MTSRYTGYVLALALAMVTATGMYLNHVRGELTRLCIDDLAAVSRKVETAEGEVRTGLCAKELADLNRQVKAARDSAMETARRMAPITRAVAEDRASFKRLRLACEAAVRLALAIQDGHSVASAPQGKAALVDQLRHYGHGCLGALTEPLPPAPHG